MPRVPRPQHVLTIAAMMLVAACADSPIEPLERGLPQGDFQVVASEPVPMSSGVPSATGAIAASPRGADGIVYVSLVAGSVPAGRRAAIKNLNNGYEVTSDIFSGGLDPVSVVAAVGDSIEVVATDSAGGQTRVALVVAARRPPVIIRTVPPKGGTDVPLNARIMVVFSETMDGRTITAASVRLHVAGTPTAGRVVLSADGLRAEFVPDGALAPATSYALVVTTAAADWSGDSLAVPDTVPFLTASQGAPEPPASLVVTPDSSSLVTGATITLRATVRDAQDNEITGTPVTWSSSNPGVAAVVADSADDTRAIVTALLAGSATIQASVGGVAGSASIVVASPALPNVLRIWLPDTVRAAVVPYSIAMLEATVTDTSGELFNAPLSWSLEDTGQAVILGSGRLRDGRNRVSVGGLGRPGVARISATAGTASATTVLILDSLVLSAVSVGANGRDACYLADDGRPFCGPAQDWIRGMRGVRSAQTMVAAGGDVRYTSLSMGVFTVCGVATGGAAHCWGLNASGEAGSPAGEIEVPTPVAGGLTFQQLSVGVVHSCGIAAGGVAYCWGRPLDVEYTSWHVPGPSDHVPTTVPGGHVFTEISAGYAHACALTAAGTAYCWGSNTYGQLGDGSLQHRAAPVAVAGSLSFAHISAGPSHTCGVTTTGEAWCWGEEGAGAGYGPTLPPSTVPQQVALPVGVSLQSVDVGDGPTCGVASDDSAYCWGFWWDGDRSDTGVGPTLVPGRLRFESVSSGMQHSCGVAQNRAVYCWEFVAGQPYRVEGQR